MKKKDLLTFVILSLAVVSCQNDEIIDGIESANEVIETRCLSANDSTIVELNPDDFPKIEKSQTRGGDNVWEELYQLNGIEFFIQSKDSYFGKNTLETQGAGKELKLSSLSMTNNAQLFYLRFLPASTGIPYLLYSYKEKVPIGVGSYPSNPDKYVLYAKSSDSGSLFGFSWDFYKGDKTYVIENQDLIGGGSNYWDIYYYSITANNGNIDLLKTTKGTNQQFTIVPNDEFTIESLDFDLTTARITNSVPVSIKTFEIQTASAPITKVLTVDESKTEETSFQESSSTTIKHTGGGGVGISIKIVSIDGKYSFEKSNTQQVAYGSKSTITRRITDQTTVTIPPYKRGWIDYQSIKHQLDVNYVLKLRGVRTDKIIEMKGTWFGVDYTTDRFIVKEYDLKTKSLSRTREIVTGNK